MENRFTVRRGSHEPNGSDLQYYELGWDTETKRLFIGNKETVNETDTNVPELVAPIYYYGMLANEATDMPSPENFPKGSILIIDN